MPFLFINTYMNTFREFFIENRRYTFDIKRSNKINPFRFGRHLIPDGDTDRVYKVPFDITKLHPWTQRNIKDLIETKGFTFDSKWMLVSPRFSERMSWNKRNPTGMNDSMVYSLYIPCSF